MKLAARWLGALLAWVLAPAALAQGGSDAVTRVDAYLATVNTLTANFSLVVRNRENQIVDRASGTLSLSRPDRFRWDYQKPYVQTTCPHRYNHSAIAHSFFLATRLHNRTYRD